MRLLGLLLGFACLLAAYTLTHRILGGVCGGLAEAWGMPVTAVRVGVVLAGLLPGPMCLAYIAAWCLMLEEPAPARY